MKDPESASATPGPEKKRVLFLGAILASFMVCFVVFGCITYVDISDLRRELREIKKIDMLTLPEKAGSYSEDLDENDEEDDEDFEEESGIPDWVPSFPVMGGFKLGIPPRNISEALLPTKTSVRVRRNTRQCQGCCRDCDCSTKKRKKDAKSRRDCKRCCRSCGDHQLCKADKPNVRTVRTINSVFKSRIGHFTGSNRIQGSGCGSKFVTDRPFALTTTTGDICAWEYAKWMKNDAMKLYELNPDGKVRVREGGMYYVYGQLIIYDSKPTASLGIMIRDPLISGGVERELAKCIETAGYLIGEHGVIADKSGSFRTCNMGSVTELYEGSQVYIVVHLPKTSKGGTIPVKTFHNVTTAFFGIIKYT